MKKKKRKSHRIEEEVNYLYANQWHATFSVGLKYYLINIVLCTILLIEHLSIEKRNQTPRTDDAKEWFKDQNEIGFSSNKNGLVIYI